MERDAKFGFGFLLAGVGVPFLIDKLFGPSWALAAAFFCVGGGGVFLYAGQRHGQSLIPATIFRRIWAFVIVVACVVSSVRAVLNFKPHPAESLVQTVMAPSPTKPIRNTPTQATPDTTKSTTRAPVRQISQIKGGARADHYPTPAEVASELAKQMPATEHAAQTEPDITLLTEAESLESSLDEFIKTKQGQLVKEMGDTKNRITERLKANPNAPGNIETAQRAVIKAWDGTFDSEYHLYYSSKVMEMSIKLGQKAPRAIPEFGSPFYATDAIMALDTLRSLTKGLRDKLISEGKL